MRVEDVNSLTKCTSPCLRSKLELHAVEAAIPTTAKNQSSFVGDAADGLSNSDSFLNERGRAFSTFDHGPESTCALYRNGCDFVDTNRTFAPFQWLVARHSVLIQLESERPHSPSTRSIRLDEYVSAAGHEPKRLECHLRQLETFRKTLIKDHFCCASLSGLQCATARRRPTTRRTCTVTALCSRLR